MKDAPSVLDESCEKIKNFPSMNPSYSVYEADELLTKSFNDLFSENDKLVVELTSEEIFHGDFIGGGKNRIDITNVKQIHNNSNLSGTLSFYKNEIVRIRCLKTEKEKSVTVEYCDNIKIDREEVYRLKSMTKEYLYIEGKCFSEENYIRAIEHLKKVEHFGIASPGILKKTLPLPILVLSTWNQTFIFDTLNLQSNNFFPEIKELLENPNIVKIMHRGGLFKTVMREFYSISVENIFDTEIVDLVLRKNYDKYKTENCKKYRNLSECLQTYLNFPPMLNKAMNVKIEKWKKRPLKESKMLYASELATYLIVLKEAQTEILLSDVNQSMDNFGCYYENMGLYEYATNIHLKKLSSDVQSLLEDISLLSMN